MSIGLVNTALVTVGPFVAIGGVAALAHYFVHLGEPVAPATPERPQPQGAIRARALVVEVVEGEILQPAIRKELPR